MELLALQLGVQVIYVIRKALTHSGLSADWVLGTDSGGSDGMLQLQLIMNPPAIDLTLFESDPDSPNLPPVISNPSNNCPYNPDTWTLAFSPFA